MWSAVPESFGNLPRGGRPTSTDYSPPAHPLRSALEVDPRYSSLAQVPLSFDHRHSALAQVLNASVRGDRVDYAQVKANLPALKKYLEQLATVHPDQLGAFSREERLAFWINAYNAQVLQLVATAYPIRSIKDIPGVFNTRTFTLAGRSLTLDKLENEILRSQFQEPRIHFALNCAARSCPPLQPTPFDAEKLEQQLNTAAAQFIRNPFHNRINTVQQVAYLSRLFEWFGADFVPKYGGRAARPGLKPEEAAVLQFVAQYLEDEKARALLLTGSPRVEYFEYEWSLNATR